MGNMGKYVFLIVIILLAVLISVIVILRMKKKYVSKYSELSELELKIVDAKRRFDTTKKDLNRELEAFKKEENLKIKEDILNKKREADQEIKEMKQEISKKESRLVKKEENLDVKYQKLEEKEKKIDEQKEDLINKQKELDEIVAKEQDELEKIAKLSLEDARDIILTKLDNELIHDKAVKIRDYEYNLEREKEKISRRVLSTAINKGASDFVVDATITVVELPNEDMKGRIIGKEGRNIRAIEAATGVDLIIDDTPEAVVLSSFDGVRREVAKIALEKLIQDGRIHPTKIEEVVEKAAIEVEQSIYDAAEEAIMEVGIPTLPKEVLKVLGKLKYRTSYGQNVLKHCVEVAHLAGAIAAEIGADVEVAKRAGLFHDIGKAFTHEQEGSHAINGADFLRKFSKEKEVVLNAVEAHHDEVEKISIEAVILQAADALSASRPGARRETLTNYLKRLEQLEEIANSYEGIENSYAIQAGRELRLIVSPNKIDDDKAVILSRDIAKEIEEKMQYPGQIKVTVVRETRAVEYAK
ncbi:ribonuclease Y [Oceanivirga salmonicida]|uniref:ribonuclease Y n=1 Tax=Oceanivirga salmonicida TaxID=1769291 RepID=UPI000A6E6D11|nr:ribonuclease Y [Oceanivirga salmonicida]